MSSFIDSIKTGVAQAAEFTVQKTTELSETAKLKLKETKLAGEINDIYREIGKLIYRQYKDQSDETQDIAARCLEIDGKNDELAGVAERLAAIKAEAAAQKAQRRAAEEAAPAKEAPDNESPAAAETQSVRFCTSCGNEIPEGANFCPVCGRKTEV